MPHVLHGTYYTRQDLAHKTGLSKSATCFLMKKLPDIPGTYICGVHLLDEDAFETVVDLYLSGKVRCTPESVDQAHIKDATLAQKIGVPLHTLQAYLIDKPTLYTKKPHGKTLWVRTDAINVIKKAFK